MKQLRLLVGLVLLLLAVPFDRSTLAQGAAVDPDLASIPISPADLAEPGYLLEGGGYLDPARVGDLLDSLTGVDTDEAAQAGLQRSYMHRMILRFDRLDPGSELLADVITLVHQFPTADDAEAGADSLNLALAETGESIRAADGTEAIRVVVESADALVSLVVEDRLLILLISSDLTGRPDVDDHAEAVVATRSRAEAATTGNEGSGLGDWAVQLEDQKLLTFADSPEAHQHYEVRDGLWLPTVQVPEREVIAEDFGIVLAYESQQVVTLNTSDAIIVQSWLARFASPDAAQAFAAKLPLGQLPTTMFADHIDQGDVPADGPFPVSGRTSDGDRYGGYRGVVSSGSDLAVVSLLATGNLVITERQLFAFAAVQEACLSATEQICEPMSLVDILGEESVATTESPAPDGTYADPTFDWSVDYEAAGWEFSSLEGGIILELQRERSLATVEPVVNRHGDSQRCLLEDVRLLETSEERAYITLGSDVDGEPKVGSDAGHVWAIYTVEPLADERADQEYTIRIDCFTLVEGEASLVVRHSAPRDLWETESAKGDDLREAIEIGGVAAAASYDEDRVTRTVDMLNPRIWIPRAA